MATYMMRYVAARTDHRRDVKREIVELLIQCVEAIPLKSGGNNRLTDAETLAVARILGPFLLAANNFTDRRILSTAKGCSTLPSGASLKARNTLWLFIQNVASRSFEQSDCFGTWIGDARLWAQAVVEKNPNSFGPGAWLAYQRRIDTAIAGAKLEDAQYILDPSIRPPADKEQGMYWIVQRAGKIWYVDLPQRPGEALQAYLARLTEVDETRAEARKAKSKPYTDAETRWKAECKATLSPLIYAELDAANAFASLDRILKNYDKWYVDGLIQPLQRNV